MVLRFLRFNAVSALGIGVQVATLWLLAGLLDVHYLVATVIAIEVSVLHNFFWHIRWTWPPHTAGAHTHVFFRCVSFHAGNGLVSMLGSLALMPLFVGQLRIHYLIANLMAIACTGLINFLLGERLIFRRG
jgi:putative flippase GtrA